MDTVLSAVLSDLTSRFISFIIKKYMSYGGATRENETPRLQRLLLRASTIVTEAEGRRVTNASMLLQLRQLREAMYRGFYAMDTAAAGTPAASRPKHRRRAAAVTTVSKHYNHHELRAEMDGLEAMLDGMNQFLLILMHCPPIVRQPYSAYMFMERCMFGRHAEKERIVNFLLHPSSSLGVLPVIGPSLVGKSTLVEHVCRDDAMRNNFSQILHISGDNLSDLDHNELRKLCVSDERRSSLIVVEIVEELDVVSWGDLVKSLRQHQHGGGNGSRVILVSSMDCVSSLGTVQALRLTRLHEEEYYYFFRVLAFGSANPYDYHPDLASIAKEMVASITDGSFMMANTITSALRANMDAHFWRRILQCIRRSTHLCTYLSSGKTKTHSSRGYLSYLHRWSHDGPLLFCYGKHMTESLIQEQVSSMIKVEDVLNERSVKYGEKFGLIFQSHIPPCLSYMSYCVVEKPKMVGRGNKCLKRKRNREKSTP